VKTLDLQYLKNHESSIANFLIYACFPLKINKTRSVEVPCKHVGFLSLFRAREHPQEILGHLDA
jgi:hypothetical protein